MASRPAPPPRRATRRPAEVAGRGPGDPARRRDPSRRPSTGSGIGRLLAPLALIAVGFAIIVVVTSTIGGDDSASRGGGGGGGGGAAQQTDDTSSGTPASVPRKYEVKPGDNLTSIAQDFGITVEQIIDLNPDLDPQALQSGEKLRLR